MNVVFIQIDGIHAANDMQMTSIFDWNMYPAMTKTQREERTITQINANKQINKWINKNKIASCNECRLE